jgi:paraquat-inducible protein A
MEKIRCNYCTHFIELNKLKEGYEYHCPRCDSLVYRVGESNKTIALISISAIVIFFWAITSPLLNVYVIDENEISVIESLIFLLKTDIFSGIFLLLTVIGIPIFMIILTLLIIFYQNLNISKKNTKKLISIYYSIKDWNMIGVYFVGLLIAMIKLNELSDMYVLPGFWINLLYLTLLFLSLHLFNPDDILRVKKRKPFDKNSLNKVTLFLILAIIFIPAANLLPIMPTYKYSVEYPNTIFDGIMAFYNDGDYVVSFIVFFASICIPLFKIIGLIVMMLMVKFNIFINYRRFVTKLYIINDVLGKYSMLDVFVVVCASSFIQYENLVRIDIGEAIIPFSLVVIFTMIASKNFDTRLIWKKI